MFGLAPQGSATTPTPTAGTTITITTMVLAPPPLPTRFPCWVRAVYSWGGEVRLFAFLCAIPIVAGDLLTGCVQPQCSPSATSASSKATSSSASTRATARGGPAGCSATGEQSASSPPTLSRYYPTTSGRPRDPSAPSQTATRPAPGAPLKNPRPSANPSRPTPRRRTTQQRRSPRHGRMG